jgi:molybdate transport system substrate-binding protein
MLFFTGMKQVRIIVVLTVALLCAISAHADSLLIYAGAASKPPTEEAARLFTEKTGIRADVLFGGSGYVLSQMKLARHGDLYFPGSSDYMEKAIRDGDVLPETEQVIVYLVSAINVQAGNPKNIHTLVDLTRPGMRVAIANPDGVCVGAYAVEIIEQSMSDEQKAGFRKNLVNYVGSCSKTASAISLKAVDAVIGWRVFQYWDPDRIETIPLQPDQVRRIGYIPIAISRYSKQPEKAQRFIDFLASPEGQEIFARYQYFATADAAMAWVGDKKPIGGEYIVPDEWLSPGRP